MTKTEVDRFRPIVTAELERLVRRRDGITIERSAGQLKEIQAASERALAVCKLDRELTNSETPLRRSVVFRKAASGTCQRCDEDIHPKRLAARRLHPREPRGRTSAGSGALRHAA